MERVAVVLWSFPKFPIAEHWGGKLMQRTQADFLTHLGWVMRGL